MAFVNIANLSGADPTDPEGLAPSKSRNGQVEAAYASGIHEPTLSEYRYWARLKREEERRGEDMNGVDAHGRLASGSRNPLAFIRNRGKPPAVVHKDSSSDTDVKGEKQSPVDISVSDVPRERGTAQFEGLRPEEADRLLNRRQMRVASWSMIFFLITTDILGPFNAPYAIANMGLVPGILCYFWFGVIASATGFIIGHLFCKLDSDRFPVRTYGDIAQRVAGPTFRHVCSILQSLQLMVNVGLICLSSGQSLYQVAHAHPCFSVAVVIWALVGMIVGQIRSLRNFSIIAQLAVGLNVTILCVSMGVISHSPPNRAVANAANDQVGYGPVVVEAFASNNLEGQVNGMFNLVFAYGGAMIFPEMISEMRRPMDFWKGMVIADAFIAIVYLFYGVFFYCFSGQFTQANAFQGLSPYWGQTLCNVLNMVSGMIAACLYGNIGIKVIYVNIVQDMFKGPPMNTRKGRIIWTIMVPVYWILAFVVANSIPALGAMTGLIGAACIFQFSYTFPPLLLLIYSLKKDASEPDTAYAGPGTSYAAADSWRSAGRWRRAWLGVGAPDADEGSELPGWASRAARKPVVMLLVKVFLTGLVLACLACAGLGLWGTGLSVKETFEHGQGTAFGCRANA